jgi:hypothetical protein
MGLLNFLDKSVVLQTPQYGKDASGGPIANFVASPAVPCCVWPTSAQTKADFARRDLIADYQIATATDIDAAAGDVLTVAGRTYVCVGYERFEQAMLSVPTLYVTYATLRNQ